MNYAAWFGTRQIVIRAEGHYDNVIINDWEFIRIVTIDILCDDGKHLEIFRRNYTYVDFWFELNIDYRFVTKKLEYSFGVFEY